MPPRGPYPPASRRVREVSDLGGDSGPLGAGYRVRWDRADMRGSYTKTPMKYYPSGNYPVGAGERVQVPLGKPRFVGGVTGRAGDAHISAAARVGHVFNDRRER